MYCIYELCIAQEPEVFVIFYPWLQVDSERYAQDRAQCRECLCRAEAQEAQNNGIMKTATSVVFE